MRIIGGKLKGRKLNSSVGQVTRPTSDRTRETIFNILDTASWAPSFNEAYILDLFAGTGALGFESVSRGAKFAAFIEKDQQAQRVIRENVDALGLEDKAWLMKRSALKLGKRPNDITKPFDIVFCDPPYERGLAERAATGLKKGGWITFSTLLVIETANDEALELVGWKVFDARPSGAAKLYFAKADG